MAPRGFFIVRPKTPKPHDAMKLIRSDKKSCLFDLLSLLFVQISGNFVALEDRFELFVRELAHVLEELSHRNLIFLVSFFQRDETVFDCILFGCHINYPKKLFKPIILT